MAKGSNNGLLYTVLGSGIAFGLFKLLSKKNALNTLQVTVTACRLKMANTFIQVTIDLLIKNPSSENLSFKNFVGTVYLDTQSLGLIDIPSATTIIANADTPVSLTSSIPITNILKAAGSFLFSKSMPSKGIVRGTVNVGALSIPVYQEVAFNSPTTAPKA
jgi:hypothetical protein